jgi:EAL domain-containing protein (putative c-di-GMP-specific phosphodiesterase class I)/response regulator of citrate/malate metabolism
MLNIQKELVNVAHGISLLYAEDETETRELYESIFKLFFKDVKSAENGVLALEHYKKSGCDLLITDLTMPKMDGIDLIDAILKINPQQHIIVMTAHNTAENLKNSIDFQVDGILLKPVNKDKLFSMLYKVSNMIAFEKKSKLQNHQKDELTHFTNNTNQALFLVVIDQFRDIIKKFGIDTKKNIIDGVKEHMLNFGVEENATMNIHDDVVMCGVYKNHLDDILEAVQAFSSHNNNLIIEFNNLKFCITLSYGVILVKANSYNNQSADFLSHINSVVDKIKNDENSNLVIKMDIDREEAKKNKALSWLEVTLEAIKQKNIVPVYQPIVDIKSMKTVSYEVFPRIKQEDKYILPEIFMDLSEKAGIVEDISHSVFKKSFKTLSATHFNFHINFTDADWKANSIKEYQIYLSSKYKIDASRVVLNIINHERLKASNLIVQELIALKKLGYKLALKGFASGNINIEILSILKPDYIIIDTLLLQKALNNSYMKKALSFILDYTKDANIKTILTGIENQKMLKESKKLGFNYVQGNFIKEPLDVL